MASTLPTLPIGPGIAESSVVRTAVFRADRQGRLRAGTHRRVEVLGQSFEGRRGRIHPHQLNRLYWARVLCPDELALRCVTIARACTDP